MSIDRVKSWAEGEMLTANDLNNEFNNVVQNVFTEPFVASEQVDLNGNLFILDTDGNTLLDASVDNTVDLTIGGADDFRFTANTFTALAGSNLVVEQGNLTISSGNLSVNDGTTTLTNPDSRTATVAVPLIISAPTNAGASVGIGTGLLLQGQSTDEAPSDFVQLEGVAADTTAGSEDTYFQILLRVAGAALTASYRFMATTAFKAIFTHANTAARTYTLPDFDCAFGKGRMYMGPSSTGTGASAAHEGSVTISASQALGGIHYYTTFTLNAGQTLTLPNHAGHLTIVASGTITINGIIDGIGAGMAANTNAAGAGIEGFPGITQPGGGGGAGQSGRGGSGGGVIGCRTGGAGGAAASVGAAGTSGLYFISLMGFPGGGGSGGTGGFGGGNGGTGGSGGGSVCLIAPTIILGAASAIKTSGGNGVVGSTNAGGGGGGGAGNYFASCHSYTDNGCTFTMTGGSAGGGNAGGYAGGAGAAGVKQINVYD